MRYLVLDLCSAPIEGAEQLVPEVKAPSNYRDPVKIAEYVAEKTAERQSMVATDLDLARITAAAWKLSNESESHYSTAKNDSEEETLIERLNVLVGSYASDTRIVTFGGRRFDLPLLMRRARWKGMKPAVINVDRYKHFQACGHRDLCEELADYDWSKMKPLDFYVRAHKWEDLLPKPMTGSEEARIFEHHNWDGLECSVIRDVEAIVRLARWWGVAV